MITHFEVQGFGCLRKVTFPLTPLHAFIGPNDSGKSTLLKALRYYQTAVTGALPNDEQRAESPSLRFAGRVGAFDYALARTRSSTRWRTEIGTRNRPPHVYESFAGLASLVSAAKWTDSEVRAADILAARLVRFDADALRQASPLFQEGVTPAFADQRGSGLAGAYDSILNRGDAAFGAIRDRFLLLFPTVRQLRLRNVSPATKELSIELRDGTVVPASGMSEGMLYYLAFCALPHLDPASLLLVEEPENGLHPARIAEVMRILREISGTGVQVVIATHSPLVVNELNPDEVSVITRRSVDEGSIVTPMTRTPNFDARSKVYALGELWLAYANGTDEAPLLTGDGAR